MEPIQKPLSTLSHLFTRSSMIIVMISLDLVSPGQTHSCSASQRCCSLIGCLYVSIVWFFSSHPARCTANWPGIPACFKQQICCFPNTMNSDAFFSVCMQWVSLVSKFTKVLNDQGSQNLTLIILERPLSLPWNTWVTVITQSESPHHLSRSCRSMCARLDF